MDPDPTTAGRRLNPAALLWETAISPAFFAVLCLLWCLDLGIGSLIAYRRDDLFGSMDAYPFNLWLRLFGRRHLPESLWVYLLAVLSWLMVASLLLCTLNWFLKRRKRTRGLGEVLVHLGFLLIFAGFVVGSAAGARSQGIIVPKGGETAVPGMNVSLRLSSLEEVRSPRGEVLDTVGDVVLREEGREAASGTVRINHPLIGGSLVVYPRGRSMLVRGGRLFSHETGPADLAEKQAVTLPDGRRLEIREAVQAGETRGPHEGPGLLVTLRGPGGEELRSDFLSPVEGRRIAVLDGVRVILMRLSGDTAGVFDVHRDPGVKLVIAGAFALALGTAWALAAYLALGQPAASRPTGVPE